MNTARSALALACGCALCAGCLNTPTPLAPAFSGSVGLPQHGVQTGAVELPETGIGFVRYRKLGGYYWGQPGLVQAIEDATEHVAEALPGGAALSIGDLSARNGGKIERHYSHRSGRDVDLLWYVTTPEGAPIDNAHFIQLGADGLGKVPGTNEYVRLDLGREWLLIKALLTSKHIEVQWLFASRDVEALLVHYAFDAGEDTELIWRAENALVEPVDSLPHDDHLHLRIACSPDASVRGCEGGGPYWNWLPAQLDVAALGVKELEGSEALGQFEDGDSADAASAAEILPQGPTPFRVTAFTFAPVMRLRGH